MAEGIRVRVEAEEALAALGQAASRARDARGLYDNIGAALVTSTQTRFELGAGPDGSPWPISIRARLTGGKTLVDTGRMVGSLTHIATDTSVEVGTNDTKAATHQFGAVIRPVTARALHFVIGDREIFAKEVRIPARPFLGLDDEDETEIVALCGEWLTGERGQEARP